MLLYYVLSNQAHGCEYKSVSWKKKIISADFATQLHAAHENFYVEISKKNWAADFVWRAIVCLRR